MWLQEVRGNNLTNTGKIFSNNLREVHFPNATIINENAFNNRSTLETANFPLATEVEGLAFYNCHSLVNVNIPNLKTIRHSAFLNCTSLVSIDFPNVSYIGSGGPQDGEQTAFYNCTGLRSVSFGTGHTTPTTISFGYAIFTGTTTPDIDLVLGEFVLPKPNMSART